MVRKVVIEGKEYTLRNRDEVTYGAETTINALAVLNDKIYGGTNPNGKLYEGFI